MEKYAWNELRNANKQNEKAQRSNRRFADDYDDDQAEEGNEEEEEEPATVDIDEGNQTVTSKSRESSGMELVNSIPVTKESNSRANKTIKEEAPCVFLSEHYSSVYNNYVNKRFRGNNNDDSEDDDDDSSDEDEDDNNNNHEDDSTNDGNEDESDNRGGSFHCLHNVEKRRPAKKRKRQASYDTNTRSECFLCAWGNKFYDGIKAKHISKFFDIMENYGRCDNMELAAQLYYYFKKRVYKKNSDMVKLTKQVALEHIEEQHSLNPLIFIGESIRRWKEIKFGLENSIFRSDGTYNRGAIADCEKAQKMLCSLYTMKIELMNFNNGKTSEDTKKIGQYFNFMPEFKQKKEKDKRIKKKQKLKNVSPLLKRNGFETT